MMMWTMCLSVHTAYTIHPQSVKWNTECDHEWITWSIEPDQTTSKYGAMTLFFSSIFIQIKWLKIAILLKKHSQQSIGSFHIPRREWHTKSRIIGGETKRRPTSIQIFIRSFFNSLIRFMFAVLRCVRFADDRCTILIIYIYCEWRMRESHIKAECFSFMQTNTHTRARLVYTCQTAVIWVQVHFAK